MAKERIPIRKIVNAAARQVTFSKRRRGLFKKAEELSILCDADVALIILNSTGKVFEYSSSSMKEILERHKLQSKNLEKTEEQPSAPPPTEEIGDTSIVSKQSMEGRRQLRQMRCETLHLRTKELQQLEKSLEFERHRVLEKKGQKMMNEIHALKDRGVELMEENQRLKQKVMELSGGNNDEQNRHQIDCNNDWDNLAAMLNINEVDGQESVTDPGGNNSSSDPSSVDHDYSSDTSLRLGLPYRN